MTKRWQTVSGFWVGLVVILIVAAGLRLASYDFSLPYIDHPDEPVFYQQARVWRGLFEMSNYLDFYPPGYLSVNWLTQVVSSVFGITMMSDVIRLLRLIAVLVNLLTLVFVALTARLASGDWAGWLAGLAWGVSPLVLENGVYAIPDPFVYLLTSLAVWLAAVAVVDPQRRHWCVWSAIAGLLTILTKYPFIPVTFPGGFVALWVWTQDRRRGLRYLAIEFGLAGLVLAFFIFLYPFYQAKMMDRVAAEAVENGVGNVLDFKLVWNNFRHALIPLNEAVWGVVTGLGVAAFAWARRHKLPTPRLPVVGLCLLLLILLPWIVTSFSRVSVTNRMRDVLPSTAMASVLLGVAVAQIMTVIPERWKSARYVLPVVLVAGVFAPQFGQDLELVAERRLPDRRVELRQWVDANLEAGMVLVNRENHKTFNPMWGGLEYAKWFDWLEVERMMDENTVAGWRDDLGVSYTVLPAYQRDTMQETEEGQAYLAEMLHLRDFVAPPEQRGPESAVYRLWRMEYETDVLFGERIHLLGYDLNSEQFQAGENLTLRLYWQASAPPETDYSLFIHFTPLDSFDVIIQFDGAPAVSQRPAPSWNIPDETLISPEFTLALPPDLAAGDYRVLIGLYDYRTGQRLPVGDGDVYEIAQVTVTDS